jgi:hypothetical protein
MKWTSGRKYPTVVQHVFFRGLITSILQAQHEKLAPGHMDGMSKKNPFDSLFEIPKGEEPPDGHNQLKEAMAHDGALHTSHEKKGL